MFHSDGEMNSVGEHDVGRRVKSAQRRPDEPINKSQKRKALSLYRPQRCACSAYNSLRSAAGSESVKVLPWLVRV
jgi:hypothetical protein